MDHVTQFCENGYAVVRNFLPSDDVADLVAALDRVRVEALKHHTTYRDHNVLFEAHTDPLLHKRVCLQAH